VGKKKKGQKDRKRAKSPSGPEKPEGAKKTRSMEHAWQWFKEEEGGSGGEGHTGTLTGGNT